MIVRVTTCSRKSLLNDHLGVKVRRAAVEAEGQSATADANIERPCDIRDAVDVLPIPIPITDVLMGGAKPVHTVGLERPGRLRMSRVTQRRFGEPDERVPDRLAIASLAIAQPAKHDQVANGSRPDHRLCHHRTSPPSLPPATLSFGFGRARDEHHKTPR